MPIAGCRNCAWLALLSIAACPRLSAAAETRGLKRTEPDGAETFTRNPQAPYAHPFFWAPFILMGNWL